MCKLRDAVKATICVYAELPRDSPCGRHKNKYAIAVHRFTIIWLVFIVFYAIQRLVSAEPCVSLCAPYLCVSALAFWIKTWFVKGNCANRNRQLYLLHRKKQQQKLDVDERPRRELCPLYLRCTCTEERWKKSDFLFWFFSSSPLYHRIITIGRQKTLPRNFLQRWVWVFNAISFFFSFFFFIHSCWLAAVASTSTVYTFYAFRELNFHQQTKTSRGIYVHYVFEDAQCVSISFSAPRWKRHN